LNINLTDLFIEIDSCETNNNIFLVLEIFNDKEWLFKLKDIFFLISTQIFVINDRKKNSI